MLCPVQQFVGTVYSEPAPVDELLLKAGVQGARENLLSQHIALRSQTGALRRLSAANGVQGMVTGDRLDIGCFGSASSN